MSCNSVMASPNPDLHIGCFIYPRQDKIDFTGPFEVLSPIPNTIMHAIGKQKTSLLDAKGLTLILDMTIAEAPDLDLLLVSGGLGQQALMEHSYAARPESCGEGALQGGVSCH